MRKKYNHIFFDLDNTLWDFEKNSKNAMHITFKEFFREDQFVFEHFFDTYSEINKQLWDKYRKGEIFKKDLIYERFNQTFIACQLTGAKPEDMNTLYLEEMANQKVLKDGVSEALQYLKNKNYVLHIITNGFKEVQNKKLETSGLLPFFTNIFVSEDVKVPKPDSQIFEYAIKSSNAKKSASLMIGDDFFVDIVGANQFGIDSVYIPMDSQKDISGYGIIINSRNYIYIIDEIQGIVNIL